MMARVVVLYFIYSLSGLSQHSSNWTTMKNELTHSLIHRFLSERSYTTYTRSLELHIHHVRSSIIAHLSWLSFVIRTSHISQIWCGTICVQLFRHVELNFANFAKIIIKLGRGISHLQYEALIHNVNARPHKILSFGIYFILNCGFVHDF